MANPGCGARARLRRSPGGSDDPRPQVAAPSADGAYHDQADPHPRVVLDRVVHGLRPMGGIHEAVRSSRRNCSRRSRRRDRDLCGEPVPLPPHRCRGAARRRARHGHRHLPATLVRPQPARDPRPADTDRGIPPPTKPTRALTPAVDAQGHPEKTRPASRGTTEVGGTGKCQPQLGNTERAQ
jgi:hypothetical protein